MMKALYMRIFVTACGLALATVAIIQPGSVSAAADATAAVSSDAPAADAAMKPAPAAPEAGFVAPVKPLRRPFDSLMFTTDEYNDIRGRLSNGGETNLGAGDKQIENAKLYLSTIVYYGPKDWTIWVNGVPIGPDQEFQSFQVTDINANSVQLLVPLSAQGMRPIKLSPNQTFVTKTGAVIEGKLQ